MANSVKYILSISCLSVWQFVLVYVLFVSFNVGVGLLGYYVGGEFYKGDPNFIQNENSNLQNFTVHFTVPSSLSRDIHLIVTPRCANCVGGSYNVSFLFIGMGPNGGVKPILSSIKHRNQLSINSCFDLNRTCTVHSPLVNKTTNVAEVVYQTPQFPDDLVLDQNFENPFIVPKEYQSNCKNGICSPKQIFVIDVHNSRLSSEMFETRSLTIFFEISIESEDETEFEFSYLTVRPQFMKFILWFKVVSCALVSVTICAFTKRMKIFYWKNWILQQKLILLLLLFQVAQNGPILLISIMMNSSFILDWLSVVLRSVFLVLFSLYWYVLLEPQSLQKSKTHIRYFLMFISIFPISFYILFFAIYPQSVFLSNFTFDVFHLAPAYPVSVTFGLISIFIFIARTVHMIITGYQKSSGEYGRKRVIYVSVLYFTNLLFLIYVASVSGFRLLSSDFLPNLISFDNCVPNALFHSLLTSLSVLIAFLFYPIDFKPDSDSTDFQVHFQAGNDEIALFSDID